MSPFGIKRVPKEITGGGQFTDWVWLEEGKARLTIKGLENSVVSLMSGDDGEPGHEPSDETPAESYTQEGVYIIDTGAPGFWRVGVAEGDYGDGETINVILVQKAL